MAQGEFDGRWPRYKIERGGRKGMEWKNCVRSLPIALSCISAAILNISGVDKLPRTSHGILEVFER